MKKSICWSVLPALAALVLSSCKEGSASATDKADVVVNDTIPAKGIPPAIAKFFADVKTDGKCPNDTTCVYLQTFSWGATREITLRVSPGQAGGTGAGIPGSAPISGFSFARRGDADSTVSIDLNYYVGRAGLPNGPAKVGQAFGLVHFASYSANAVQAGGAGIYWGEVGKKGADATIGAILDYAKDKGKGGPIGSIYSLASSLSDVSEAMDLSQQHTKWLRELDALEKCASNPTNRLAITDPGYQARTVAKIRAARGELTEVTGVRFLNKMTEKSADLTPVTAVMAVGLKQGFAWSEQTLGDYSENTIMREARVAVVKCGDPGNAAGNLDLVSECQAGPNDHETTHVTADVSWEWQAGIKYVPHGNYKYSSIRKVGNAGCTITKTAEGSLDGTGYLFVFSDPAQIKQQGYGYEARFVNWPAQVTIVAAAVSSCGISTTLKQDLDWIPVMHGYLGTGGSIEGVMPGPACKTGQPSTLKWSFSVPAPKK